jgi:succinyl-CoA synthetase beta subunit
LVAKPDQLIKRRGNNKLILLKASWDEAKKWISERMGQELTVDGVTGKLDTFIVEEFVPHPVGDEYYLAIRSIREGDEILFLRQGGVNVGDVESQTEKIVVGVFDDIDKLNLEDTLLRKNTILERKPVISQFIKAVYQLYRDAGFVYLEINPVVWANGVMIPLDLAGKIDDTAEFESGKLWGGLVFPTQFGREATEQEQYIARLDAKSGSSLKFTLLNAQGRIWTLVAGGGASVIYADTIADLGHGQELANYGEYSGNPTDDETHEYTRTVLELMTKEPDPLGRGKILIVGGGIANFTDVAKTFGGICRALRDYCDELKRVKTKIYVRRGGPNYREGLKKISALAEELGLPIEVYGPETHMTRIVRYALAA